MPARSITNTRSLDVQASAHVLAEAIEQRARAHVRGRRDGREVEGAGTVVGEDRSYLVLELIGRERSTLTALLSSDLQVSIEVAGVRYVFQTRCSDEPTRPGSAVIHVFKPDRVARVERRRSPRRQLREPTEVALCATGADAPWHGWASLLNVSAGGLACRLGEKEAATLSVDQFLRVTFDLSASSPAFDLTARVINITRGSTADHLILGLEFTADRSVETSRRRLQKALNFSEE